MYVDCEQPICVDRHISLTHRVTCTTLKKKIHITLSMVHSHAPTHTHTHHLSIYHDFFANNLLFGKWCALRCDFIACPVASELKIFCKCITPANIMLWWWLLLFFNIHLIEFVWQIYANGVALIETRPCIIKWKEELNS